MRCVASGSLAARRGFSLIEMLAVMMIMTILGGLTVPALKGFTGSDALSTGARKFAGLLNVARSEAIARHTLVRLVIAQDWSGQTDANHRKISLWAWDNEVEKYLPLTQWEALPMGVIVEGGLPSYIQGAAYAQADAAAVRGDSIFDPQFAQSAAFDAGIGAESITTRFVEFSPTGTARVPGGTGRQAIFVTTQGYLGPDGSLVYTDRLGARPANWAQVNVDTLTGRVRVYQP